MTSSLRARTARAATLLATTGLVTAGLLVTAPPSQAAPFDDAQIFAETSASGRQVGTNDPCLESGAPANQNVTLVPNQPTDVESLSSDLTVTDPDDPNDTADYGIGGQVGGRVTTTNGKASGVFANARTVISGDFSEGTGSTCVSSASASGGVQSVLNVPTAQLVTASVQSRGDLTTVLIVSSASGQSILSVDSFGGRRSATFVAPRGQYSVIVQFITELSSPSSEEFTSVVGGTGTASVQLAPIGSALTATQGAAKPYVQLPGARDCDDNTLAAKLTAKAKNAKSVVFSVNGHRNTSVTNPQGNRYVFLFNLPETKTAVVRAVVTPEKGKGKPVSVSRTYRACKAY